VAAKYVRTRESKDNIIVVAFYVTVSSLFTLRVSFFVFFVESSDVMKRAYADKRHH
jgi:hypothetical protein